MRKKRVESPFLLFDLMNSVPAPELSIVVPILNEGEMLVEFCQRLSLQEQISFELILCDGGSHDGTFEEVEINKKTFSFPIHFTVGKKGRAVQMNSGAQMVSGPTLLFLHADSFFNNKRALRRSLNRYNSERLKSQNDSIAGRFSLRFTYDLSRPPSRKEAMAYYFYESKARLPRLECINGDQGFMMRTSFFKKLGGFEETLPFLEDKRMVSQVADTGRWILFPEEIVTSARRFQREGLYERQVLNALIMNFFTIGWEDFFQEIPHVYQSQDKTKGLRLYPIFAKIEEMLSRASVTKNISLWWATGGYVNSNAWQIAFYFDSAMNFHKGVEPGKQFPPILGFFDTLCTISGFHSIGKAYAAIATWVWFKIMLSLQKIVTLPGALFF